MLGGMVYAVSHTFLNLLAFLNLGAGGKSVG